MATLAQVELHASTEQVAGWESALPDASGTRRLALLVQLAWHLRQRDSRRASHLVQEARSLLADAGLPADEARHIAARLRLADAEIHLLFARIAPAEALAREALQHFTRCGDRAGQADAHFLLGQLASDKGDVAAREAHQRASVETAQAAGDAARAGWAQSTALVWAIYADSLQAQARWRAAFGAPEEIDALDPATRIAGLNFWATVSFYDGNLELAAERYLRAFNIAKECGQLRQAILSVSNVGAALSNLHDYQGALAWTERALELARPTGWPAMHGNCLSQVSSMLTELGRYEMARQLLHEALEVLEPLAAARPYALARSYLADLEVRTGDYAAALGHYELLAQSAAALDQYNLKFIALRGQASTLAHLGQGEQALAFGQAALRMAEERGDPRLRIEALRSLAGVHALCRGLDGAAPEMARDLLAEAYAQASGIAGYQMPPGLLEELAQEHAYTGDYQRAYESARAATEARKQTHSQAATNRAVAIQVMDETARARAEAEHQRALAAAEAARVQVLQSTSVTLESLSSIGREVTTKLDPQAVFATLELRIHELLETSCITVYLLDDSGALLHAAHSAETELSRAPAQIRLDDALAPAARCVRERCEIHFDGTDDAEPGEGAAGGLPLVSQLFAPLVAGERVLGVMTVQAPGTRAYGEREKTVFRSLCAYGAIAFDNAFAYRKLAATLESLRQTQAQLVQQEKMASLGTLTAGIAHEINNPANFADVGAQLLDQQLAEFRRYLLRLAENAPVEITDEIGRRIDSLRSRVDVVREGTSRISSLVRDLGAFARINEAERKAVHIAEGLLSTVNLVRPYYAAYTEITCTLEANPLVDCYPARLNQVFMNLLVNACQAVQARHGGSVRGLVQVRSLQRGERLLFEFIDNGCGIPPAAMDHLFEPFFTTKEINEGTGLGLSISFSIVKQHGGAIHVESTEGEGSRFVVELPLAAPGGDT